jgi:hypothetical protein
METLRNSLSALALSVLMLCGVATARPAFADPVGKVTRMQGEASRVRLVATSALAVDAALDLGDVVATGAEARLELTFLDGTRLTLGEKARLTIDDYVYQPNGASGRMKATINGAFRFVSGSMGAGPNTLRSVVTPVATIGIRGTDFWGGPLNGLYGVFLFEGEIEISPNAGPQLVSMASPGIGIDIDPATGPAGPPIPWASPKIGAAVDSVTFR